MERNHGDDVERWRSLRQVPETSGFAGVNDSDIFISDILLKQISGPIMVFNV